MSWHEAVEDGIPVDKDSNEFHCYYPPCHICKTPVYSWSYIRGTQYTCVDCRTELAQMMRAESNDTIVGKKQKKLQNAIKRISRVANIAHYSHAIHRVEQCLDKAGWFQSTEEIMVALELIRCGVKAHHQVRIFDYTVDFILPDLKVALEIDGIVFHGRDKIKYQSVRDNVIIYKLGEGWEMLRITTDNINKNVTNLLPAIHTILARRSRQRG
jgi:very-short-patch-repair endonuclease